MPLLQHNPLDPPAAQPATSGGVPSARLCHAKPGVLVVDDEPMVRTLVQLGLEHDNFVVWSAATGREAIRLYAEHREHIDMVLLDVRMPELDGPQTLDGLRALNPAVLACFMTGDLGAYQPDDLRRRGAAHVIAKPFHLDDLACLLRRLLDGVPADLLPSGGGNARSTGERINT